MVRIPATVADLLRQALGAGRAPGRTISHQVSAPVQNVMTEDLRLGAPQAEGRGNNSPMTGTKAGASQLAGKGTASTHPQAHQLPRHPLHGAVGMLRMAGGRTDGGTDAMSYAIAQQCVAMGAAGAMLLSHRRGVGYAHTSPGRSRCTTWRSRCPPFERSAALCALDNACWMPLSQCLVTIYSEAQG